MLVTFRKDTQVYDQAVKAHHEGRLADAEKLYRQVLAQDPNHADSLHMLGLVYFQAGHPQQGEALMERALALTPTNAATYSNLAEVKRMLGKLPEAESLCRRALAIQPDLGAAYANLAMILSQQRRFAEALPSARRAVELCKEDGGPHGVLGMVLLEMGNSAEALPYLQEAVRRGPPEPLKFNALALCYERLEQREQAYACHQQAAAQWPENGMVIANFASMLARAERYREASGWFEKALGKDPQSIPLLDQYAGVKMGVRQFEEAIALARRVIAQLPPETAGAGTDAYATIGESQMFLGRFDECISEMRAVLQVRQAPSLFQTLSNALVRSGRPAEGLAELEKALQLDPQNPILHFNKAIILLMMGRFEEAWPEYEWRWQHPRMAWRTRAFRCPKWDGSPLNGKRILLHAEQGLGDTVFFGRYITRVVEERGGEVVVFAQNTMLELVKTIRGVTEVIGENVLMPPVDFHLPIMSLPGVFGTTLSNVPAEVPYVKANAERCAFWKGELERLAGGGAEVKVKVGLVWEGGPFQPENFLRSASLAAFAPLAEVPGVAFFGLQKGAAEEQAKNPPAGMHFTDLGPSLRDFTETAAVLDNLDLLISIDTSVVHVAGALGKPIWMLLAYTPGHMWMYDREDSPWYPTMRIFRQKNFQEWTTPVQRIRGELEAFVRERGRATLP